MQHARGRLGERRPQGGRAGIDLLPSVPGWLQAYITMHEARLKGFGIPQVNVKVLLAWLAWLTVRWAVCARWPVAARSATQPHARASSSQAGARTCRAAQPPPQIFDVNTELSQIDKAKLQ